MEWIPPKPRATRFARNVPLDFSMSSTGLAITGHTNSATELLAFLQELDRLAALLPDDAPEPPQ